MQVKIFPNDKGNPPGKLTELHGVEVRALNQAVKRNLARFPKDFMFQLTTEETTFLKITNCDLKDGQGNAPTISSLRIYRAGCRHALHVLKSEQAPK